MVLTLTTWKQPYCQSELVVNITIQDLYITQYIANFYDSIEAVHYQENGKFYITVSANSITFLKRIQLNSKTPCNVSILKKSHKYIRYKLVSSTGNGRKMLNPHKFSSTRHHHAPCHLMNPQSRRAKQVPHKSSTDTYLNRASEQPRDYSEQRCQTPNHWTQWSDDAGRYTSHTGRSRPGEVCHSFLALEHHQNQQTNSTNSQKQKTQSKHQTYKNMYNVISASNLSSGLNPGCFPLILPE